MKVKNDLSVTYMGNLQQAWYANEVADSNDIDTLLKNFKSFDTLMHHTFPLFYVLDYTNKQYIVMTDAMQNIAGYHPREFLESGMEKLMDVYNKDDFKIFNQQIFATNAAFLKNTPQSEHQNYLFSYNFRFIRSDKKQASVLQRNTFITSTETNLPLYSLGMILDITDVKTDTVMVQSIEKNSSEAGRCREVVLTNYFYPNQEDTLLTRREKEILLYLAEGYSSKQVADKLLTSERTIVNHKQNMLRKTNAKNVTELVVFAIRSRLI